MGWGELKGGELVVGGGGGGVWVTGELGRTLYYPQEELAPGGQSPLPNVDLGRQFFLEVPLFDDLEWMDNVPNFWKRSLVREWWKGKWVGEICIFHYQPGSTVPCDRNPILQCHWYHWYILGIFYRGLRCHGWS